MLRDIFLTFLIPAALFWAMKSARASVLVLLWVGFQRPYDFSWGVWNSLPVWLIAFCIAFASNLARGQLRPKCPPFMALFLIFVAWITLTSITAFDSDRSWIFYNLFIIPMVMGMWLVAATINDLQLLKYAMWVSAGGLGINAVKTGLALAAKGGGSVSSQISGFVGDNNVFGLTLCLTLAMLMGLRTTLPPKRWLRVAYYVGIFFIIITIIFTKSRGALLSVGVILFLASLLGGKPIRHLIVLFLCATFTYWVVPSDSFERLDTLKDYQADESAMGRIQNWKLAWQAAKDNPILGIGMGNHIPYHVSKGTTVTIRVAHSIYFQTLGELSFIGLALYLVMVFLTLGSLWAGWRRYNRLSRANGELLWLRNLYFWLFCGFVGYMFGAAFLNTLLIEFPWYTMLYIALLRRMARQAETPPVPSTSRSIPESALPATAGSRT